MTAQNTTPSPLATLINGKPVRQQDGHDIVTVSSPTCPLCGGDLLLRRVEVREVTHRLKKADVYDGGLGLMADVDVFDESDSDECLDVQSDSIVCGNAFAGCTYEINGGDLNIDWS